MASKKFWNSKRALVQLPTFIICAFRTPSWVYFINAAPYRGLVCYYCYLFNFKRAASLIGYMVYFRTVVNNNLFDDILALEIRTKVKTKLRISSGILQILIFNRVLLVIYEKWVQYICKLKLMYVLFIH